MSYVPMSAVRVQGGREREAMRSFAPLHQGHPSVGNECAVCGLEFRAGDVPTVIPLGPGEDMEQQAKAQRGGWYTCIGVIAHAQCAGLRVESEVVA